MTESKVKKRFTEKVFIISVLQGSKKYIHKFSLTQLYKKGGTAEKLGNHWPNE